jgi:hypothetical protein
LDDTFVSLNIADCSWEDGFEFHDGLMVRLPALALVKVDMGKRAGDCSIPRHGKKINQLMLCMCSLYDQPGFASSLLLLFLLPDTMSLGDFVLK